MVEANNPDLVYSKRKAITALLLHAVHQEKDGQDEMLNLCLHLARASGYKEFMWGHIEPYILTLFSRASPLAITLLSSHIQWSSPTSSNWVQLWEIAVYLVSYTDEVGQSVVDTLLQIASVDSLQPYIPANLWSWVNKKLSLPPICYGRSMGSIWSVVQMVRALGDIKTLKSYLFLIWSPWDYTYPCSPDQMHTLIQEEFSGIEMFNHQEDLLQHLNHILAQLDLGLDHLQQYKPRLNQDDIQQMKIQYGELKRKLLEVNGETTNMLLGKPCRFILLLSLLTPTTGSHSMFMCAIPLQCL